MNKLPPPIAETVLVAECDRCAVQKTITAKEYHIPFGFGLYKILVKLFNPDGSVLQDRVVCDICGSKDFQWIHEDDLDGEDG